MKLKILKHPDTFLRQPTEEVELPLSEENNIILDNMIKIMYQANGIGLAANQIGYNRRMFVMDTSNERNKPQTFINPVIRSKNNIKMIDIEGCLSCPGEEAKEKLTEEEGCLSCQKQLIKVRRPMYVGLKWFCRHGEEQYKTFYHLAARVIQHEMDHLNGKLIID